MFHNHRNARQSDADLKSKVCGKAGLGAKIAREQAEESIRKQATYVAHERIAALTQSMALEDQAVSETATAELLQREAETLAAGVRKRIW